LYDKCGVGWHTPVHGQSQPIELPLQMSTSWYKRLPLAGFLILIAWVLIDLVAHRLFLAPIYAATPHLWRPFDQINVALIYAVTFGLIAIFVAAYRVLVRPKSLRAGLLFGLFLGLALGTAVGFGTYIHAPIPLPLAWGWFIAGSIKGVAAGAVLGALVTET
jgi:hypothetical protein